MDVRKYHLSLRMIEVIEKVLLNTPNHTDGETIAGPPTAGPIPGMTQPMPKNEPDSDVPVAFENMLAESLNRVLKEEPKNAGPIDPPEADEPEE